MSNTKFTPGPWRISEYETNAGKVYTDNGYLVADCSKTGQSEYMANAALTAAAPDMVEVLKDALAAFYLGAIMCPGDLMGKVEAALNKANPQQ